MAVMVAIKMRLNTFFYLSHLIFCNSSSAASSTMYGETHGCGRVVSSWMVLENGAIGFTCTIFSIPAISPRQARSMDASHSGRGPQQMQATALAKRGWRCIPTVTAAALEHLFCWYYCDGSGGLGVEMGQCLMFQWFSPVG